MIDAQLNHSLVITNQPHFLCKGSRKKKSFLNGSAIKRVEGGEGRAIKKKRNFRLPLSLRGVRHYWHCH